MFPVFKERNIQYRKDSIAWKILGTQIKINERIQGVEYSYKDWGVLLDGRQIQDGGDSQERWRK